MAEAKPKTVRKTKQTCFPFDLGLLNITSPNRLLVIYWHRPWISVIVHCSNTRSSRYAYM